MKMKKKNRDACFKITEKNKGFIEVIAKDILEDIKLIGKDVEVKVVG